MRKFYLISTLLLSSFISFAQQTTNNQITGNPVLNEELIPVQKGDSFFIKPNIALSQKRPFLTNAFRALGAATAAYGASHAVESRGKNTSAGKAGILPEAGAAIFLTAPQLAKIARHTKTYLQYFVYDKNKKLISTNIVPVTKQVLKKNAGYIPGSKITEDGFVRTMIVGQDRTGINYASPNINVVPAKKDNVEEVVAATLKPAQLESISKLNVATTRPRTITNNKIAKGLIINPAAVKKAKANNKVIKIAKDVQNKTPVKNGTAINKKNENIAAIKIALIKPSPLKQQPQRGIPVFHKVLLYIRRKKSETEEDGTKTDGTSPEEPSTPISQPMEIDPTMDDDDDDADCDVDEDEIDGDGGGGGCGCGDGGDDDDDDDDDDDGEDDDGDGDGEIYDQVPNTDAPDYFDYIDTEGGLGYIYNYDGQGGEIIYTYDSLSEMWNISSWSGDYDPTDYNTSQPATSISAANASTDFFGISGSNGYVITPNGSELLTYLFNSSANVWNLVSGTALNDDANFDITAALLAASNDPTLSENTQGIAPQVKSDILADNYTAAIQLIITTYGFNTTNSSFTTINKPYPDQYIFYTSGAVGTGNHQTVEVPIPFLLAFASNQVSFGSLVRLIGHEYLHVQQKSGPNPIQSQPLREFLAYVYSLTATGLPAEDALNKAAWKKELTANYNLLTPAQQQQYKTIYQTALNS